MATTKGTMAAAPATSRLLLAFASASAPLTADEYARIREAGRYLAIINENIQQGKEDPFGGLNPRQLQDLLAYAVYTKENSFTDTANGDTPLEDSVRDLIRRTDMFLQEGEKAGKDDQDKEYLNTALVNQLNKLRQKPLVAKLETDDKGAAHTQQE